MKRIIPFLITILLFSSVANVFALDNKKYQEKGDAIFRDLDNFWAALFNDHAGIYNEYKGGDPNKDSNHFVIQMSSEKIEEPSFDIFKSGESGDVTNYEGAYRARDFVLAVKIREQIIAMGRKLKSANIPFIEKGKAGQFVVQLQNEVNWDINNNRLLDIDEIKALRCDGFVEYCYAKGAGVDIGGMDILRNPTAYNELNFGIVTKYSPLEQRKKMRDALIQNPTLAFDFSTSSHYNALNQWNDPQSKDNIIEITWENDATDEHSGLWGYFVKWDEKSDTIPQYIKDQSEIPTHLRTRVIEADKETGVSPQKDESSALPDGKKWYFHIRSIDKAGNWDEDNKGLLTTMHIGPFFIDKTLPSISISGVTNGGVYYGSVTVKYTVRDKYLKTNSVEPKWEGPSPVIIDPDNIPNSGDEYTEEVTASKVFEPLGIILLNFPIKKQLFLLDR